MARQSTSAKWLPSKTPAGKAAKGDNALRKGKAAKSGKTAAAVSLAPKRSARVSDDAPKRRTVAGIATPGTAKRSAAKPGVAKPSIKTPAAITLQAAKVVSSEISPTQLDIAAPQTWLEPWTQVSAATARLLSQDAFTAAIERNMHFCQTMARFSPLHLTLQMVQGLMPPTERRAS